MALLPFSFFFFSSRRRHTRLVGEWSSDVCSSDLAFRLYDTFGFPLELTHEVAAGRGFAVDAAGFEAEYRSRQERSRAGSRFARQTEYDLPGISVRFEGYERLEVDGARVAYLRQGAERVASADVSDVEVWLVLDRTPFYAERGGQVGDAG